MREHWYQDSLRHCGMDHLLFTFFIQISIPQIPTFRLPYLMCYNRSAGIFRKIRRYYIRHNLGSVSAYSTGAGLFRL